jgi:DNA-binding XRE family transcriptional regulator
VGAKYPSARRLKIHHNYSIEEVARALGVHKNTIGRWERAGLQAIDDRRPKLFHGVELRRFLSERRQRARRPCPPGYMYCLRCRAPKMPYGDVADLLPVTASGANLRGICDCGTIMNRRVSQRTIADAARNLTVTIPEALLRLRGSATASLNGDFIADWITYAETQPPQ